MYEFEFLINIASKITGVLPQDIVSKKRHRPIVEARMMCSNVLKKNHKRMTTKVIGSLLNIDHATVLYHARMHASLMSQKGTYKEFFLKINEEYCRRLISTDTITKKDLLKKKQDLEKQLKEVNKLLEDLEKQNMAQVELKT
jgi:hypothetical protein